MKNLLNYQSSEYDCGPVSLTNALRFLFQREELAPDMLRAISLYTLDAFGEEGLAGGRGTSRFAMQFLANWFNQYGACRNFPIEAQFAGGELVFLSPASAVTACLQQGGAAVVRCYLEEDPHYVLLTAALGDDVGLFDPYFMERAEFDALASGARFVADQPRLMNRVVSAARLNQTDTAHYALGPLEAREALLLFNQRTRRTEANAIEYMI